MQTTKTVLAAAALSLGFAFAGHTAELHLIASPSAQPPSCIRHTYVRVSDTLNSQAAPLGCAQFLSTNRVVQPRHTQHA